MAYNPFLSIPLIHRNPAKILPHIMSILHPTVVSGSQKNAVSSAVTRLEMLIDGFRRKQPFTHFLSFALNDSQVQEGFHAFKAKVLEQFSQVFIQL